MTGEWTLAELVGRAAQALADAGVRAPNGRVNQLPDARMIRWYATIGIVDKPNGFRGRTALYGHRHLLQLVAIKRLQAQGLPLAEIQARLTGATAAILREIAGLIESVPKSTLDTVEALEPPRPRFWAARPAPPTERPADKSADGPAEKSADGPAAETAVGPAEESADRPAAEASTTDAALVRTTARKSPQGTLHGVGLPGGAMLLVPANVHPDQVAAIRRAAQPLLEHLSILGLLNPDEGAHA